MADGAVRERKHTENSVNRELCYRKTVSTLVGEERIQRGELDNVSLTAAPSVSSSIECLQCQCLSHLYYMYVHMGMHTCYMGMVGGQ